MAQTLASPTLLLLSLSGATFLVRTSGLMLGPLLVALAAAFHTSVTAAGLLAAATNLSWLLTALFMGPVSDTYGRRQVGLTGLMVMAIGLLGSVLAWNYWGLLAFRLLTGVGAAMIQPNNRAAVADHFPPAQRGKAFSILISASLLGPMLGLPLVALMGDLAGWRLPFGVVGGLCLVLWGLQWAWFPRRPHPVGQTFTFLARYKAVSRSPGIWYVLGAAALYNTATAGLFTYLAAFLIRTYGMQTGATALPLAVAGTGAVLGSLLGGAVAGQAWRIPCVTLTLLVGGVLTELAFAVGASPWLTMLLAGAGAGLLTILQPVTNTLIADLAGESRGTANGMLAVSNQLGAAVGASVGGVVLALGGFSLVGILCLSAAVAAAVVIGVKVRSFGELGVERTAA